MKFPRFSAFALISLSVFFFGCSEEKEVVPEVSVQKPKPAVVKAEPVDEDPEFKPMTNSGQNTEKKDSAKETKVEIPKNVTGPVDNGDYVIQVGIQPSKKSAETLVNKLAEKGIKAYYSSVENPGELEGTYYRVRVGFFISINDAQEYGRSVLEANGFPWWVDNRSNDAVGNPASETSLYESDNSSNSWEESDGSVSESVAEPASAEENVPMEEVEGPIQEEVPAKATETPAVQTQPVAAEQTAATSQVEEEVVEEMVEEVIEAPAAPALEVEEEVVE